mgnify:FL=1
MAATAASSCQVRGGLAGGGKDGKLGPAGTPPCFAAVFPLQHKVLSLLHQDTAVCDTIGSEASFIRGHPQQPHAPQPAGGQRRCRW